ncbi:uncharacterized protein F5891DRAFT_1035040 [Suillus fuscotomentosus]|uniref:NACHT domain-containing protein n=1 Tax=Suillus fuscotomentosus TaxID=1912939 RepID=A0AAD4E898_9AGAM|nr:uncharacterized protein F5891DRAFT_1035040 [Suillus fuscotomentosus]KAG1900274.1 hypothetical protein F5891DRAFT_1035040 [Suillus fuscotomentosus]
MDPITSGLTILQLVQTIAQASALVLKYVASVRNADSSSRSLLNEFSSIGGVLTTVMEIEKDGSLSDNLRFALSNLVADNGPVAKLQMELKNILPNEQETGKMKTMTKWTWPFKEKEAGEILNKLKGYCVEITNILAIDAWITLTKADRTIKKVDLGIQEVGRGMKKVELGVQEVGRKIQEVGQGIQESKAAQETQKKAEEREKFLRWMNPVPCTEKHRTSRRQRHAATGRWIFHAEQYVAWNTSNSAFLWLNGQPGSGKTILASAVIDEIEGGGEKLGYFYCNFRDDQTTNGAAVLRSLVVQLLRQSTDDWVTKIKPEQEDSNANVDFVSLNELGQQQRNGERCPTDLTFLRQLLVEASKLVDRPVLVIDALDECKDYSDLVEHLADLAGDAQLRLFVTGRSELDIQDAFHNLPTMSLKDSAEQMKADICTHITEQLKTQKRLSRLPETLRNLISEKLLEKAEGMFRWVQCQLDEIRRCARDIDIKEALNNLPAGLDETYDRIMCGISQKGRGYDQIAHNCLLWLVGALTPLTLDQLNEAMMIDVKQSILDPDLRASDPMDIVVACGSLVTYDETTAVVALSHYSVKEYLISRRPNNILKSISDAHAQIFELLITYVLCDIPVTYEKATGCTIASASAIGGEGNHPLQSYAVEALAHLCHVSDEDPRVMAAMQRLHLGFLHNTEKHALLESLIQSLTNDEQSRVTSSSLLLVPLRFGNPWMVETLVKEQPDLLGADVARGFGSPLIFTITSNLALLSVLLKLGIDLNKPSFIQTDLYHRRHLPSGSYTPISWAATIGSEVAVELLLSRTELTLPANILHTTILHTTILSNQRSAGIILKLCQRGADVTFTVDGSTLLHALLSKLVSKRRSSIRRSRGQWLSVIEKLVRDLSVPDWTARTALHIALDNRLSGIVVYLLEQNAPLTATATLDPNIWSWAEGNQWFAKVQAAALAADKPYTRIMGKIVGVIKQSQVVEFPGAVSANHGDPEPICAVVVSVIDRRNQYSGLISRFFSRILEAGLFRGKSPHQNKAQDFPENDEFAPLKFRLSWKENFQYVSSRLFDYHQGDAVTSALRKLTRDADSTGDSLFLRLSPTENLLGSYFDELEYALDIYRGHRH